MVVKLYRILLFSRVHFFFFTSSQTWNKFRVSAIGSFISVCCRAKLESYHCHHHHSHSLCFSNPSLPSLTSFFYPTGARAGIGVLSIMSMFTLVKIVIDGRCCVMYIESGLRRWCGFRDKSKSTLFFTGRLSSNYYRASLKDLEECCCVVRGGWCAIVFCHLIIIILSTSYVPSCLCSMSILIHPAAVLGKRACLTSWLFCDEKK